MKSIHPYLNFPGNTEAAFEFYRSVFGGEFLTCQRFRNMPGCDKHVPAGDLDKIMHVSLPLANGTILMGTDALESMGQKIRFGNNNSINLETDSEAEATTLFERLTAGGTVEMAPQKMFWGAFFGSGADRFGVQWMVHYTYPSTEA